MYGCQEYCNVSTVATPPPHWPNIQPVITHTATDTSRVLVTECEIWIFMFHTYDDISTRLSYSGPSVNVLLQIYC